MALLRIVLDVIKGLKGRAKQERRFWCGGLTLLVLSCLSLLWACNQISDSPSRKIVQRDFRHVGDPFLNGGSASPQVFAYASPTPPASGGSCKRVSATWFLREVMKATDPAWVATLKQYLRTATDADRLGDGKCPYTTDDDGKPKRDGGNEPVKTE